MMIGDALARAQAVQTPSRPTDLPSPLYFSASSLARPLANGVRTFGSSSSRFIYRSHNLLLDSFVFCSVFSAPRLNHKLGRTVTPRQSHSATNTI